MAQEGELRGPAEFEEGISGPLLEVQSNKSVPKLEEVEKVAKLTKSTVLKTELSLKGSKNVDVDSISVKTVAVEDRGVWSNKLEFLLASMGNLVGLGNVWRFPYLVYKYGGGAFLIPYVISLFVVGVPVLLLETSLGQFTQLGPAHLFRSIMPIASGLGFAQVCVTLFTCITYNIIITWIIYYFFMSFSGIIGKCGRWASTHCVEMFSNMSTTNITDPVSSADEFFNIYMLNKGKSIEHWSWPSVGLTLSLIFGSFILACMVFYGISTSGKVVYVTAIAPYLTLTILLIRALMLEGSWAGIVFYLKPSLTDIWNLTVWREAVSQVIFSLGLGMAIVTLGSYNRFHNRVVGDIMILTIGDLLSSLFAGLVVFSMLGFVAHRLGKHIDQTVTEGFGLVFIVLIEGIVNTTLGPVWVVLFTLTLFLLAIDSMLALTETIVTGIYDTVREHGGKPNKPFIAIIIAALFVFLCLPLTTSAGIYLFTVIDSFTNGLSLVFAAIAECVVVNIYGANKFLDDIHYMTGFRSAKWLRIGFQGSLVLAPVFMSLLMGQEVYGLIVATRHQKLGKDFYPVWAFVFGWIVGLLPVFIIFIGVVVGFIRSLNKPCKVAITETEQFRDKAKKHGSYADKYKSIVGL